MSDSLSELTDLSRRLNQASDRINQTISETNAKLKKLNLGLEVWVTDSPISRSEDEEIWLGYCEVEGEWQLAARRRTCEGGPLDEAPEEAIEDECRPLLRVGRGLRLDALRLIPRVSDEIKRGAERLLVEMEDAEKLARNL